MPRAKKENVHDPVMRLLKGYSKTLKQLAEAMEISEPTARKRIKSPENITLGELRAAALSMGIPADEVRSAIRF